VPFLRINVLVYLMMTLLVNVSVALVPAGELPAVQTGGDKSYGTLATFSGVASIANIVEMVATPKRRARLAKLLFGRVDKKTMWQRLFKDRQTIAAFLRLLASGVGIGVALAAARKGMMLKATPHEPARDGADAADQLGLGEGQPKALAEQVEDVRQHAVLLKAPEAPVAVVTEPAVSLEEQEREEQVAEQPHTVMEQDIQEEVPTAMAARPAMLDEVISYSTYGALEAYRKGLSAHEATTMALPPAVLGGLRMATQKFLTGVGPGLSGLTNDWPSLRREYERLLAEKLCASDEAQAPAQVQDPLQAQAHAMACAHSLRLVFEEYFKCWAQDCTHATETAPCLVCKILAADSDSNFFSKLLFAIQKLANGDPSLTPVLAAALRPEVFAVLANGYSWAVPLIAESVAGVPALKEAYKGALARYIDGPMVGVLFNLKSLQMYVMCLSAEDVSVDVAVLPRAMRRLRDLVCSQTYLAPAEMQSLFAAVAQWPAMLRGYEQLLLEIMQSGCSGLDYDKKYLIVHQYLQCLQAQHPAERVVIPQEVQSCMRDLFKSVTESRLFRSLLPLVKEISAWRDEYQQALVTRMQDQSIRTLSDVCQRFLVTEYLQCLASRYEPASPVHGLVQEIVAHVKSDSFWQDVMRCGGHLAALDAGFDGAIGVVLVGKLDAMIGVENCRHGEIVPPFDSAFPLVKDWPMLRSEYKKIVIDWIESRTVQDDVKRVALPEYLKCLECEYGTDGTVFTELRHRLDLPAAHSRPFFTTLIDCGAHCASVSREVEQALCAMAVPLLWREVWTLEPAGSWQLHPKFQDVRKWPALRNAYKAELIKGSKSGLTASILDEYCQCLDEEYATDGQVREALLRECALSQDMLHVLIQMGRGFAFSNPALERELGGLAISALCGVARPVDAGGRIRVISVFDIVKEWPLLRRGYESSLIDAMQGDMSMFDDPGKMMVLAEYLKCRAAEAGTRAEICPAAHALVRDVMQRYTADAGGQPLFFLVKDWPLLREEYLQALATRLREEGFEEIASERKADIITEYCSCIASNPEHGIGIALHAIGHLNQEGLELLFRYYRDRALVEEGVADMMPHLFASYLKPPTFYYAESPHSAVAERIEFLDFCSLEVQKVLGRMISDVAFVYPRVASAFLSVVNDGLSAIEKRITELYEVKKDLSASVNKAARHSEELSLLLRREQERLSVIPEGGDVLERRTRSHDIESEIARLTGLMQQWQMYKKQKEVEIAGHVAAQKAELVKLDELRLCNSRLSAILHVLCQNTFDLSYEELRAAVYFFVSPALTPQQMMLLLRYPYCSKSASPQSGDHQQDVEDCTLGLLGGGALVTQAILEQYAQCVGPRIVAWVEAYGRKFIAPELAVDHAREIRNLINLCLYIQHAFDDQIVSALAYPLDSLQRCVRGEIGGKAVQDLCLNTLLFMLNKKSRAVKDSAVLVLAAYCEGARTKSALMAVAPKVVAAFADMKKDALRSGLTASADVREAYKVLHKHLSGYADARVHALADAMTSMDQDTQTIAVLRGPQRVAPGVAVLPATAVLNNPSLLHHITEYL